MELFKGYYDICVEKTLPMTEDQKAKLKVILIEKNLYMATFTNEKRQEVLKYIKANLIHCVAVNGKSRISVDLTQASCSQLDALIK